MIEEEAGGNSVADIFKHYGESFFRDKEVGWKGLCFWFSCSSVFRIFVKLFELLDFLVSLITSSIPIFSYIYIISCTKEMEDQCVLKYQLRMVLSSVIGKIDIEYIIKHTFTGCSSLGVVIRPLYQYASTIK